MVERDPPLEHGAVICGEADDVTERMNELQEVAGIDHVLCWTRLSGLSDELVTGNMGACATRREDLAADVVAVIREIGGRRPSRVSHSMEPQQRERRNDSRAEVRTSARHRLGSSPLPFAELIRHFITTDGPQIPAVLVAQVGRVRVPGPEFPFADLERP